MKLSKNYQALVASADSLAVVWYEGGMFYSEGYAIQWRNECGHGLVGAKPLVWKTEGGALRVARRLRPDLNI